MTESRIYQNLIIGADMQEDDNTEYQEANLADVLRFKMKRDNKRFWAGDK